MEFEGPQRVAVIHDASRDLSAKGIKYALQQLHLKPGDQFALVAVLDRFFSPMGYKMSSDASSFTSANKKIVGEILAKKRQEFAKCSHIRKLSEYCQKIKIAFNIEVHAGYAPQIVVNAAQNLRAIWLIFDRQKKKDYKHVLDKLPCGILRITNNSIEKIRVVPKLARKSTVKKPLNNMEMIQTGGPQEEFSPKRPMSRSLSSEQLMTTGGSNIVGLPQSLPLEYSSSNSITIKVFDNFTYDIGEQIERESGISEDKRGPLYAEMVKSLKD